MHKLRFIDLFAGLGGFHQALSSLGHKCVFASEIDPELCTIYQQNFGLRPAGDIRETYDQVPPHDILCAGFPCQPFSKAGLQLGFECSQWGNLFSFVEKILRKNTPSYLLIENVPNLLRHNEGATWLKIQKQLRNLGYQVYVNKLSPHMFGVPQVRERAIIVGSRKGSEEFHWPQKTHTSDEVSIYDILDETSSSAQTIGKRSIEYINAWQDLLEQLPKEEELPSFPIWGMEFGATYPYEKETPYALNFQLDQFRGSLGRPLRGISPDETLAALPKYATGGEMLFPDWKIKYIRQNREFYKRHKKVIDPWRRKIKNFAPSFQKLEWNWRGGPRDLWKTVIQFRASGIRAKRPTASPSLVALTTSQVPVIASQCRYMSMRECARLQSMGELKYFPRSQGATYKALGNAVNVKVIKLVAQSLLKENSK